jgi:stage III sporulation protein AF
VIAAITDWVKNIVLVVLFASFLELLLPSSGMQRFVRVIMGLLILLAILTPVVDVLQSRFAPEVPALGGQSAPAADRVRSGAETLVRERDQLAVSLYKKDLARQIRAVVVAVDGVADARVAVEVAKDRGGRAGAIGKVTVYVQPGLAAEDRKVTKITVGGGREARTAELRPALRDKIVRTVSELYQLPAAQIEIVKMN